MKKGFLYITIIMTMFCTACEDWLTVQPETSIAGENLYTTDEGCKQALNGLYLLMRSGIYSPEGYFGGASHLEYMAWNLSPTEGTDTWNWATHVYEQSESMQNVNTYMFMGLYEIITNANSLIAGSESNKNKLSTDAYNIIRGEALAIRALVHLDLMRFWGSVPSEVDASRKYLPYVTINSPDTYEYLTYEDYMTHLFADLDLAEDLLGKSDPVLTEAFTASEISTLKWSYRKSHINYYGVLALQARAHLWYGDREEALRYALLIRDAVNVDGSPKWRFTTLEDEIWDNTETDLTCYSEHICGVKCDNYDYMQGRAWRPNNISYLNKSSDFVSVLFDGNTDDFRYQRFWAYSNSFMGRGYYCYKYLNFYSSSVSQKNFPIIRLPEIYFIIMECGTLAEANNAYELYCTARNISFVPFTESDRQERIIVEFMREYTGEGQNFFMYKRNNVRRMLFASEDCSVEQYMIPIPEGEFLENN